MRNFVPFKDRHIVYDRRVRVYRCLLDVTKPIYSIMQDGLVCAHASSLCLQNVRFIVQEGGRQRVLRERRKNVHAFVEGILTSRSLNDFCVRVHYDPYYCPSFYTSGWTDQHVTTAQLVKLDRNGVRARDVR